MLRLVRCAPRGGSSFTAVLAGAVALLPAALIYDSASARIPWLTDGGPALAVCVGRQPC
jgi:hypothetical protein